MEAIAQGQFENALPVAWQHQKDLGACMIELYDKNLWTDVKFRCKDHEENESERIHGHKIVLASRSSVFQAMFFGPTASGKDEVQLDNDMAEILDLFLRYIYSDTVNLTKNNASSVLEMAHYYHVSNLVQFCADYIATIITPENACETLTLALCYDVTTLKDACSKFIDRNADEVLTSDGFLELSEDCLTYILKGDTFYTNEESIFKRAEEWPKRKLEESNLERNGQSIRKTLGTSFYYLRLPTMEYQTLSECTRKKGYFSIDEYEDIVDFINEVPGSSVKSNSCVARLSTEETLEINNECEGSVTSDSIATSFSISVSRDVIMTDFVLCETTRFFRYDKKHFTDQNCSMTHFREKETISFASTHETEIIKFKGRKYASLQQIHGEDLPNTLDIEISGNFKVTCHNKRANNVEVFNERNPFEDDSDSQPEEEADHDSDKESEDGERLSVDSGRNDEINEFHPFDQDFQLQSSQVAQRLVKLKEPLKLTKANSPYTVELTMRYSCESNIKMKTRASSEASAKSKYGFLEVEDIGGQFAGIKSLRFENISNRDTVKETDTSAEV